MKFVLEKYIEEEKVLFVVYAVMYNAAIKV